jgi:pimeloyl-ACP methyl ester carboxylesterase
MQLLFVHGALVRDGAWWWRPAAELLRERTGVRSGALALPSCRGDGPAGSAADAAGLAADAAALRAALDTVESPDGAIVVAHSYGGTVVAEAGAHPAVARLLYISSYLPDLGTSQADIGAAEVDPVSIAPEPDGTLGLSGYSPATFAARFLQDVEPDLHTGAWERLTRQAAAAFTTPTTREGWRDVDSTYLVCTDDRNTSIELQRFHAARATRSVELPTGHHPFLSRPELVVEQIEALLR